MMDRKSVLWDEPRIVAEQFIHNMEKVIVGKRQAIELIFIAVLAGGHVLLEDVPGVGKTRLVKALAKSLGCSFKRIQFTPDLLPSDVTGVTVYHAQKGTFEFRPGPVMANLVLADEINRTSPKTQAALLEAMEERQVTVDGETRALDHPFIVFATQNPLEFEGTFELPEAQLDRFLLRVRLGYPSAAEEIAMLGKLQEHDPLEDLRPVMVRDELVRLQEDVRSIHVDEAIKQFIVETVQATRRHPDVQLGASPRASIAVMRAAQAAAFIKGRSYVVPDDVKELLPYTLAHRIVLLPEAKWKHGTADYIIRQIVDRSGVPVHPLTSAVN
ncbi:AAA family ATPase [Paenibacillus turpanensis]|uniref:AAA family ATPase n=1 Tax=Paenibacillus turpanensis TaxID=2689078 RepID=UPI001FB5DA9D|nr:MoxR family ATPase [Paenibacillus turpanensis]